MTERLSVSPEPTVDAAPTPTPPAPSLAGHATRGVAWLVLQTGGAKVVATVAQVVLAWLLEPEDFGLLVKVFAVAALPGLLYQYGLREVLLGRGGSAKRLDRWAGPATWMAGALGILSAVLMLAAAPVAAWFFYPSANRVVPPARGQLILMVAVLAWAAPMLALGTVPLAQLQARLQFRAVAGVNFVHLASISVLSVLCAIGGLGSLSFVLPWPLAAMGRLVALWALARPPLPLRPRVRLWRYLAADAGHVLAARALALVTELGDYVVLSRFHPDPVVGVYYFAFNLSLQTAMLLALNLDGVLMPVLSKLKDDPAHQRDAFLSAARAVALVGVPVCLVQAVVAGPAVRLVFDPKWFGAIPVLQVLSVGMALRVVTHPAQSLMRAQGRFKALTRMNAVGAVAFVAMTTVAASRATGDSAATWVAAAVAAFFAIEGPAYLYASVRQAGGTWRDVAGIYAAPLTIALFASAAALAIGRLLPPPDTRTHAAVQLAVLGSVSLGLYGGFTWWLTPQGLRDLLGRTRGAPPAHAKSGETA